MIIFWVRVLELRNLVNHFRTKDHRIQMLMKEVL